MKKTTLLFYAIAITGAIASCSSGPEDKNQDQTKDNDTTAAAAPAADTTPARVLSVPAPFQVAQSLQSLGLPYKSDLVNPHKKVSGYNTEDAKALNLGVYIIDLGYAVQNDQGTGALNSIAAVAQLSKDLNISASFDKATLDKFKANEGKQDSLVNIVLDQFSRTHTQLQSTGRSRTAYLIFTGAFTEGLYLIANLGKGTDKQEVKNLVAMQKLFLKDVLELLRSKQGDQANPVLPELEKLEAIYQKVEITYSESEGYKKMNPVTIDKAVMDEILNQVNTIRKLIVT